MSCVNSEEIQNANLNLGPAADDLLNIISNMTVPTLILGADLCIRSFTPKAGIILNLNSSDVGRPITDLHSALDFSGLEEMAQDAIATISTREREVLDRHGRWHSLRVRPYKTTQGKIEGAVVSLVDIHALKSQATELQIYAEAVVQTIRESLLVLDASLNVRVVNDAFLETFHVSRGDVEDHRIHELGNGQWNVPALLNLLGEILPQERELRNFELTHDFRGIGRRTMRLNARQIRWKETESALILLAIEDITERKQAVNDIEKQARLLDLAHDAIIVRDKNDVITFWNRGAEQTYGWTDADAQGKNTHDLLKTEFPEPFDAMQEKLFTRGFWEGELTHTTRNGERIVVTSRQVVQRDHDGGPLVILEINRDITERKSAQEALRHLSGRILQLQDEERRRIARELHDGTGQNLAAMVMQLTAVCDRVLSLDEAAGRTLREVTALARQVADETRTLSYLLHPPQIDLSGLSSALRWLVEGFSKRSKIPVDLELPAQFERLSSQLTEMTVFRIVQEALSNIFRHSESTVAAVRLSFVAEDLKLEITDKGKGMPPEVLEALQGKGGNIGVGLLGMGVRVRQLGGTFHVSSGKAGTTITATFPHVSLKRAERDGSADLGLTALGDTLIQ